MIRCSFRFLAVWSGAAKFGVLCSDGVSERALFVIDKNGITRYIDVHDINLRTPMEDLVREIENLSNFRLERDFFRSAGVDLRYCLCDVPAMDVSAQSLDLLSGSGMISYINLVLEWSLNNGKQWGLF